MNPPTLNPTPSTSAAEGVSLSQDALPGRIEVTRAFGALHLQWRWRNWWQVIPTAVFCAFWDGSVIWALVQGFLPPLFAITHGASGLFITYSLATMLFNKTHLEVTNNRLRISVRPLPWRASIEIPIDDVKQLYAKEIRSTGSGSSKKFSLIAQRQNGTEVVLMRELDKREQARALEGLIEDHLRIKNVPVAGES